MITLLIVRRIENSNHSCPRRINLVIGIELIDKLSSILCIENIM